MKTATLPFKIKIASPCTARWEDMGGDDRVRFCDHCHKNVYNLSTMGTAEATALLEAKQGRLCARIYQRVDGTVLTEDCPVGLARQWRRVKTLVAGGVGALLFAFICATALGRENRQSAVTSPIRQKALDTFDDVSWKVKGWFGIQRPTPRVMGEIAVMPIPTPPPNTLPSPTTKP